MMACAGLALCAQATAQPGVEAGARVGGGEGLDYYSLFVSWPSHWLQTHAVESWLPGDLVQAYWDLSVERWEGKTTTAATIKPRSTSSARWRASTGPATASISCSACSPPT
ncbi:hypothetical protein HML84_00050 [Alcanivorax sp. IO_7]|nr:hypothetical protein HML84_00050 [Alcanivorax sp. IO_7]